MASVMVIPVFIPHQGCPHRCIFCNQNVITADAAPDNRLPGPKDLSRIISAYLSYKKNRQTVELAFFGGNFLGLPEKDIVRLLAAASPWLEKGLIQGIRCSTRPDTVTKDTLDLVKPLGLDLVELGVQSMDNGVLALSRRGHTREDTLTAVGNLKAAGMGVGVQLMAGLPGDAMEKCLETAEQVAALTPDLARIYPALVLDGSPLAGQFRKGTYQPLTLDEAVLRVGNMVNILERADIPVVRLGLQAGEALDDSSIMLAGPWHPAFGHLVRSALVFDQVRDRMEQMLKTIPAGTGRKVALVSHPRSESRLRGDKNSNLEKLKQAFPGMDYQIRTDPDLPVDQVEIKVLP